jgi:hypothetical protein
MPLVAGGMWPESSPRFDPARAIRLLGMYAKLLLWYTPIALAGWIGLAWESVRARAAQPEALLASTPHPTPSIAPTSIAARRESAMLLAIVGAQLLFVISLGTDGACQYGPRLLLPTMPFACLGLTAFAGRAWSRAAARVLFVVGAASIVINLVGALYGTMFCDVGQYAFLEYADAIRHRHFFSFPLIGIEGVAPY